MDYKVQKNSQNNDMASLVNDVCNIIETGRKEAYVAAGKSAVITYWNIGRRIVKEEQQGKERAEYGAEVIKNLALKIIPRYGASYNKRNLACIIHRGNFNGYTFLNMLLHMKTNQHSDVSRGLSKKILP